MVKMVLWRDVLPGEAPLLSYRIDAGNVGSVLDSPTGAIIRSGLVLIKINQRWIVVPRNALIPLETSDTPDAHGADGAAPDEAVA